MTAGSNVDLHDLGVAGVAVADRFVGRVARRARRHSPRRRRLDAAQRAEDGIQAPETAAAEGEVVSVVAGLSVIHFWLLGGLPILDYL